MMPTEPRLSTSQLKPAMQRPGMPLSTGAQDQDHVRWKNLFARTAGADTATGDLAYGCVDWYLYSGEPLRSVGY